MTMKIFRKQMFLKYLGNTRAIAAVEFAMVSIMFLTIIFGTIEAGRVLWIKSAVQYGVEDATRYVLVNSTATDNELITHTKDKAAEMGVDSSLLTVTITRSTLSGVNIVDVNGSYSYSNLVPFLPESWSNMTLTAVSRTAIPAS